MDNNNSNKINDLNNRSNHIDSHQTLSHSNERIQESLHEYPKRKSSFFPMVAAAVLGSGLTLSAMQLPFFNNDSSTEQIQTSTPVSQSPKENTIDTSSANNIPDMIESVSPAIVGVINMQKVSGNPFFPTISSEEQEKGTGSGVVYKTDDKGSYIVTNNHVVEGATNIKVQLSNGKQIDAELVGTDALTDIAVLKINGGFNIKSIPFANSQNIRTGDRVFAIGNPLGLDFANSVTEGIISAKERTMDVETSAGNASIKAIQTDAAINPGNSGGALLNTQGDLIGINSMKIAKAGVEGIGFAIPSNDVKTIIDQIVKNGKVVRPYLGLALVSGDAIPIQYLEENKINTKEGVFVVRTDDYADKVFDVSDFILEVDGQKVKSDSDLKSYIYSHKKTGDDVTFKIIRNGKEKVINLKLRSSEHN